MNDLWQLDISVTETGVQIVTQNVGGRPLARQHHEQGSNLWPFFQELVKRDFSDISHIKGMKLVAVDTNKHETQWSFKPCQ